MKYKGKEYRTYPEIITFALSLKGKDQELFVEAYLRSGPCARENIGYVSGYYDMDTMKNIQRVFKTAHPIFGRIA